MAKSQVTIPFFIPLLGCPHRCVFCDQRRTAGNDRLPDGSSVREKTERLLASIKPSVRRKEIAFFGGTFTALPDDYQMELLESAFHFVRCGRVHGIRVSTRPDFISPQSLTLLKLFGVTTVEVGAQSFSDEVLSLSGRGHSADDTIRASTLVKESGMDLVLQLMPGLPGDNTERSVESAAKASEIGPRAVRIYPTVVIRGTLLEEMYRMGRYTPLSMEEAVDICAVMHRMFNDAGIEIIRTGIHPPRDDDADPVVAGPYHPAFGFMVKSRVKRNILEEIVEHAITRTAVAPSRCSITVPEHEKEEYIGFRKDNIDYLKRKFGFHDLPFRADAIPEPRISL